MKISNRVYVKKINTNELGYSDGKVGNDRGPAILISKKLQGFFPPLSELELNDSKYISLCTEGTNNSVLLNFIYFNSKKALNQKGGRDEKRIYISKQHYDVFSPGDYVVFYKIYIDNDVYFFLKTIPIGSQNHNDVSVLVKKDSHAEVSRRDMEKIVGKISPPTVVNDEVDQSVIRDLGLSKAKKQTTETRARSRIDLLDGDDLELFENSSFRKLVLFFYGKTCAISEHNIIFKNVINIEVAHILSHSAGGIAHPTNGIPLCRDLYWAFDRGMFLIEPSAKYFKVKIHPDMMKCDYLSSFNGVELKQPHDLRYLPKTEYFEWHKTNIYGTFNARYISIYDNKK
jgi:hypothetical protein